MSDEQQQTEEKPGLLSRMVTGVKGFFKHALSYIPTGIIFTGVVFGISAAIEHFTGYTGFPTANVLDTFANGGVGGLAAKFATHLAIGSVLSGAIGGVSDAIKAGGNHVEPFIAPTVGQSKQPAQGESQGLEQMMEPVKKLAMDAVMPGLGKLAENTGNQILPNLVKQIQR